MEDRLWRYMYNAAKELKSDFKLKKLIVTVIKITPVMIIWTTLMIFIGCGLMIIDDMINVKYWIRGHIDDRARELVLMCIGTAVALCYVAYLMIGG